MYEYFDIDLILPNLNGMRKKKPVISANTASDLIRKVFKDENKLIRYDEEHPREERYDVLGCVGSVLFVVCAFKKDNVIRIISASCI